MNQIAVVGAGFSGAVLARELAECGRQCIVFDKRDHVGGNCYTERNAETGIIVHKYGPHIFHTMNEKVWEYVNQFTKFKPYRHTVRTNVGGKIFSMPINLHTINQFFNLALSPGEAEELIASKGGGKNIENKTLEEQGINFLGEELYSAFIKGYTKKQWGIDPKELPASILKRLPVRFNYDDNYFNHVYQGMPENGYTEIFENMLDHANITVELGTKFDQRSLSDFDHVFYSGPIDEYFDYEYGQLGYRTLIFEEEVHVGDYQGCAVMNYGDEDKQFTRITEHKYFSPWEEFSNTVIYKEYSALCTKADIPYYPIRLVDEKKQLAQYVELAEQQSQVTFMGRLGTYRYLDMDVTIEESLGLSQKIKTLQPGDKAPIFSAKVL